MSLKIFDIFKKPKDSMVVTRNTDICDLLPIGSVVAINDCDFRLVIIGIKQLSLIDNHEYDYLTVPYPMGKMGDDSELLINNDDIISVDFIGYQDTERFEFVEQLKEYNKR